VVSQVFANTRKVARHQRVYALVGDLLEGELHALALHLMTPEEWQQVEKAPSSPKCRGGE
jgi:BolA protein